MSNIKPGQMVIVRCNSIKGETENKISRMKVTRKARFVKDVNEFCLVEIMKYGQVLYKECVWPEDILEVVN